MQSRMRANNRHIWGNPLRAAMEFSVESKGSSIEGSAVQCVHQSTAPGRSWAPRSRPCSRMPGTRGRSLCCWKATGPCACLPRGFGHREEWGGVLDEQRGRAACSKARGCKSATPVGGSDGARRALAGALRARYAHGERCAARGVLRAGRAAGRPILLTHGLASPLLPATRCASQTASTACAPAPALQCRAIFWVSCLLCACSAPCVRIPLKGMCAHACL